ncbi:MAG: hypothetical protein C0506_12465 [Anaerolinea sp.]|nr:hypothetical protein [Anaerolinea sp.]
MVSVNALHEGQRVVSPGGEPLGEIARVGRGRFLVVDGKREVWLRDDVVSRAQQNEVQLVCEGDRLFAHVATPPTAAN